MKVKTCQGNYNVDKFQGCGSTAYKFVYGLCPKCLYEWMTTTEKGKIYYAKQFLPRVEKVKVKHKKQADKKQKDNMTDWALKLQEPINKIVKLLDIGQPCMARRIHSPQIHAGHIYSRGSNSTIRFNLHNIHRQGAQSNHFQNEDGLLREGIKLEYGADYLDFITSLQRTPSLEYANHEYKEFVTLAVGIVKMLKRQGRTLNLEQRLEMRNEINQTIGIYNDEYCVFKPK